MSIHLKNLWAKTLRTISIVGFTIASTSPALAGGVSITSYGHSALLIKGDGKSIMINPFKAVGCAEGLQEPKVNSDIILASSELADEGARIAGGTFLVKPGSYRIKGINIEGFAAPHDRLGGRRFGQATLWRWNMGGLSFAHLGGSAAPLTGDAKILLGNPDILIIAVGGGAKVYNSTEAAEIVRLLKPRRVIPVQYVTGETPKNCDQTGVNPFLDAMEGTTIQRRGQPLVLPEKLNSQTVIEVLY